MYFNRTKVFAAIAAAFFAGNIAAAEAAKLSFTKDVAPILNARCAACHRPGQMAPMSLLSYDEVRPWVKAIRENVSARKMPPWHATAHAGSFMNDRSLSEAELSTVLARIDQGAPRGNPSDLPPAPVFPEGKWKLGEPDFVITLPEVEIPADGPDVFQKIPGTVALPEDQWVSAVEILPGAPKVVHHVIVFQIKGFDVDPAGGWLGAWAAGTEPMVFPKGTGRLMQKGANVIGDMHWHPSGEAIKDQTRIGLHFAKTADIEKELVNLWVLNQGFKIPAGDPNHEVRAKHTFAQDSFILGFAPHMHYRGKDFTYTAHYPDGREELLLKVENYDFNWQTDYILNERLPMPKGTTVECVAHFDNSANNPANPDPTRDTTFGEETKDEMMIGFLDYVVAEGVRPKSRVELYNDAAQTWLAAHPGEIYGVKSPKSDGFVPLYVPKTGEGRIMLGLGGSAAELSVTDIVWTGNDFTSRIPTEQIGDIRMTGTLDPAAGTITVTLSHEKIPNLVLSGGHWKGSVQSAS